MAFPTDKAAVDDGVELLLLRLDQESRWGELLEASTAQLAEQADSGSAAAAMLCYFRARAEEHCGEAAVALSNYSFAAELFAEHGDTAMELRCQIGAARAHLTANARPQAAHLAGKAAERAAAAGLDYECRLARLVLARTLSREHRHPEAVEMLREIAAFFEAGAHAAELLAARQYLAWSLIAQGRVDEGEQIAKENVEQLRNDPHRKSELGLDINSLVFAAWLRGDFEAMLELHQQLIDLESPDARPARLLALHYNKALGEIAAGRYADARRNMQRAWANARKDDDRWLLTPIQLALALLAIHDGQPAMAVEYAELAQANIRDQHSDETALVHYYLAVAYLSADMPEAALNAWRARQELEPSLENAMELDWLLAALHTIERRGLAAPADAAYDPATLLELRQGLTALQAAMPQRPPRPVETTERV